MFSNNQTNFVKTNNRKQHIEDHDQSSFTNITKFNRKISNKSLKLARKQARQNKVNFGYGE